MRRILQGFLLIVLLCGVFFIFGIFVEKKQAGKEKQAYISLSRRIEKLEKFEPDFGDSMRELQMEMAKLWTAEQYHNRDLALYEIKEIKETLETIDLLDPVVNGIQAAGVLDAMKNSQIAGMENALRDGNEKMFKRQYQETLLTCNQCHRAAGVGFNVITVPSIPPISNQEWKPAIPK